MEDAQTCTSDYSTVLTDYIQTTVAICKHTLQGIASKDNVAGEFLHQDRKVIEIGVGVCEEFVHS